MGKATPPQVMGEPQDVKVRQPNGVFRPILDWVFPIVLVGQFQGQNPGSRFVLGIREENQRPPRGRGRLQIAWEPARVGATGAEAVAVGVATAGWGPRGRRPCRDGRGSDAAALTQLPFPSAERGRPRTASSATPRGAGGRWWSWPGEESAVRHPVHSIYPTVAYGEALVALTTAGILADHSGLRSSGNWKEILMMTCSRGSEQTVSSTRVHRGEESQRQQETSRAGAEGHGIQILSNLRGK
ncbi:uncharacterized protein [Canis lupus baileyi]|uniref:uncharacterized protein isoform X2 n=1 Tax=Canis lupus baileyi TaxID=143281 RepID=UPI003B973A14